MNFIQSSGAVDFIPPDPRGPRRFFVIDSDTLPASAIPPANDRMVTQIREGLRDHVALHHRPAPAVVGHVVRARAGDELDAQVARINNGLAGDLVLMTDGQERQRLPAKDPWRVQYQGLPVTSVPAISRK